MKVRAKILSSGDVGWFDFWAGIEKWTYEGSIDIAKDAELREYASDEEREQGLKIIRGIWNLMAENPRTEYAMNRDRLDALETETLTEIMEMDEPRIERQHLLNLLQAKHPSHDRDTIRRRVDSIVEKGQLDRLKDGATTFYALKAGQRREMLTA